MEREAETMLETHLLGGVDGDRRKMFHGALDGERVPLPRAVAQVGLQPLERHCLLDAIRTDACPSQCAQVGACAERLPEVVRQATHICSLRALDEERRYWWCPLAQFQRGDL